MPVAAAEAPIEADIARGDIQAGTLKRSRSRPKLLMWLCQLEHSLLIDAPQGGKNRRRVGGLMVAPTFFRVFPKADNTTVSNIPWLCWWIEPRARFTKSLCQVSVETAAHLHFRQPTPRVGRKSRQPST
jgi:hypothetical protein